MSRPSFSVQPLLDFDLRVAGDLLPGFDVARVDVALLISGDEIRQDAKRQQLLDDVGLGQRRLQRAGNSCATEAGTPAGAYITQDRLRSKSTPCSL